MMSRTKQLAVVALVAAFSSACLTMEERLTINRDLSGRARLNMTMDLGAATSIVQRIAGNESGVPAGADLTTVMQQQMKEILGDGMFDIDTLKKNLPAGVTLANAAQSIENQKMSMAFDFQFTDAKKLQDITLPMKTAITDAAAASAGIPDKPVRPFENFEFTDDGATLLIATKEQAAVASQTGSPVTPTTPVAPKLSDMIEGMQVMALVGEMLKGFKASCVIESPMTVVESNATSRDGTSLVWELKLDDLMKQTANAAGGLLPSGDFKIRARFKK